MHAASVNPEPGSNSRLKSLYLSFFTILTVLLGIVEIWLFVYLRTYTLPVLCTFKVLCTISSLFNFQGSYGAFSVLTAAPFFAALVERLDSISQNSRFVNRFFKNNFGFFALCNLCA